ncbi:MAG TPA: SpoIIE family protein phosphatase [Allosphingosinicella sp.]|nr:SpoIIE family protein phosphatase [Allosphingosinicella sp.]
MTDDEEEVGLSVLVADDDALLGDYLCMALESLGCAAELVGDGQLALRLLREKHFDVLITDWMMPEMDGMELVRRVRLDREEYLHVILMTATGRDQAVRTALEAGVDDFLHKPFQDIQIELGINAARRVVQLQRRLEQHNRRLTAAHEQIRDAYRLLKEDLAAAAEMQQSLLPGNKLDGPLRQASTFIPSLDIGGDALGVLQVEGGRFLFFNFDVSGHGVPAALNSFALHSRMTRLAPSRPEDLVEAAQILNEDLLSQGSDAYMTAAIGLAEADGTRLWLLRAGHPMPVLVPTASPARFLEQGGLPLGMLPGVRHEVCEMVLDPGDRLLIYSDGVIEEGLGEAGLLEAVEDQRQSELSVMIGALERRLLDLREGRPPQDDVSMLSLEAGPRANV